MCVCMLSVCVYGYLCGLVVGYCAYCLYVCGFVSETELLSMCAYCVFVLRLLECIYV